MSDNTKHRGGGPTRDLAQPYTDLYKTDSNGTLIHATTGITVRIPMSDSDLLRAVWGGAGLPSYLTHITIKTVCNELRKYHITTYSPDTIVEYVRRLTTALTSRERPLDNVADGAERLRKRPATQPSATDTAGKTKRAKKSLFVDKIDN